MGIGRNEACDQAVKQAFMSDFETSIPLGLSELSNPIRNNINKKRQFLWETTTKGRWCYKVHPLVGSSVSFPRLSQRDQAIPYGLRLRHFAHNSNLHRIGCHPMGFCERCWVPEYLEHILTRCPRYGEHRSSLFHTAREIGIIWSGMPDTLCHLSQKFLRLCKSVIKIEK